jgi:hypothetical protein
MGSWIGTRASVWVCPEPARSVRRRSVRRRSVRRRSVRRRMGRTATVDQRQISWLGHGDRQPPLFRLHRSRVEGASRKHFVHRAGRVRGGPGEQGHGPDGQAEHHPERHAGHQTVQSEDHHRAPAHGEHGTEGQIDQNLSTQAGAGRPSLPAGRRLLRRAPVGLRRLDVHPFSVGAPVDRCPGPPAQHPRAPGPMFPGASGRAAKGCIGEKGKGCAQTGTGSLVLAHASERGRTRHPDGRGRRRTTYRDADGPSGSSANARRLRRPPRPAGRLGSGVTVARPAGPADRSR